MGLMLVTGAPGWLGLRLVRVLMQGSPDIPCYTQSDPDLRLRCLVQPGVDASRLSAIDNRIEVVVGDVRNAADCARFCKGAEGATMLHCVGLIHPRLRVQEFFDVNSLGTHNILAAAEGAGLRRVVAVSSNAPMGVNPTPHEVFDENSPYHPYVGYGRSKLEMEQHMHAAQARGKIQTVIARPPWFYGPDQPPRQTLFFSMIKNGGAPILGDGNQCRSMTYVDNLCQGLILCAKTEKANGETYWLADRQPYTMNQIVDTVERLLEKDFGFTVAHKRLRLPDFAGNFAQWVDRAIQGAGFYHQKIHVLGEMNKNIACSVEKAVRELGYDPKVALEEGMRRSIQWCLDQGIKI